MTGSVLMSQPRALSRHERAHHRAEPRAGDSTRRALPRPVAFWLVGAITVVLLAASSAPTPLYPVYQVEFGFSALTLTLVFAAYVVALLVMLLTVGRLSDHVGRRPVLGAALLVEAVAMMTFVAADATAWLFVARVLQGLATGAAIGVVGAYLLDLQPPDGSRLGSLVNSVGPTSGLALGAAGTGLLVQYAPHPTRLVFVALTAAFILLAGVVGMLPETVRRIPGAVASLRPQVAVPTAARGAFAQASPIMIATWGLGGLVLSLGASVLGSVLGLTNYAAIGVLIGAFAGSGALAGVLFRDLAPERLTAGGTAALVAGTGLFLIGLLTSSLPVFVVALVVSGAGFGGGFLGALRSITQLAAPHERAALLSAVYVISYLAFSIPAVIAGVFVTQVGLRDTAVAYGAVILVLAVATGGVLAARATVRRPGRDAPDRNYVRCDNS